MKSSTTPDFWTAYQALPKRVRNLARKTYQLWQALAQNRKDILRWRPNLFCFVGSASLTTGGAETLSAPREVGRLHWAYIL
jgi:hypothetical protein